MERKEKQTSFRDSRDRQVTCLAMLRIAVSKREKESDYRGEGGRRHEAERG